MLDREWKARTHLPQPRSSPPATSAQKQHAVATPSSPADTPPSSQPRPSHLPQQQQQQQEQERQQDQGQSNSHPERSTPADPGDTADDMEVDIGGTPEPDPMPQETVRDAESDEIVGKVERAATKWGGLEDLGWATDLTPVRCVGYCLSDTFSTGKDGFVLISMFQLTLF